LSSQVGANLAAILSASGVEQRLSHLLDPLLTDIKPSVAQIHSVISDLADLLRRSRVTLDGVVSLNFRDHQPALFNNHCAELTDLSNQANSFVDQRLGEFGPGSNFLARDPEEIRALIRNAIYDRLLDTTLVEKTQVAIKQRLYDVEHAIRQGLDSAFGQVN